MARHSKAQELIDFFRCKSAFDVLVQHDGIPDKVTVAIAQDATTAEWMVRNKFPLATNVLILDNPKPLIYDPR